jgi:HSP20 family protein
MFEDMLTAITRLPFAAISPPQLAMARTEVSETDKDISIVTELPGVSQADVEVSLDDDVVTIRAETRDERTENGGQRDYSVTEREYGRMVRAFRLPFSPDPDQVEAQLQDGLLTIRIAKPQSVQDKSHKIEVRAGSNAQQQGANGGQNAATPTDGGGAGEKNASAGQNKSGKTSQGETAAH